MRNKEASKLIEEQKYEEAANLLSELIDRNPHDPIGYINFGNLCVYMRNYPEAETFFERAIELDSTAATAYYGLGNLNYERNSFNQAKIYYLKAIKLGLDISDVYYMLGLSLMNEEHNMVAIPYLLRAIELDQTDDEKLFQYGLALANSRFLKEAKATFHKLIARNHSYSDAHYNLGMISLYDDETSAALIHFETALQIQPDHVLAANGKDQVRKLLNKEK